MKSEVTVDGVVVNDQNWLKLFLPIIIWIIFWIVESVSYCLYFHPYYGYKSILFAVGMGFLLFGILQKNGLYYRVGFYIYLGFALISIITDIVIIIFIWFFFETIAIAVGLATKGAGEQGKQAGEIVGWVLLGYQIFFSLAFVIDILCELCFLCVLKRKIPYFDAYEQYKNQQLLASSPV